MKVSIIQVIKADWMIIRFYQSEGGQCSYEEKKYPEVFYNQYEENFQKKI